ncbi:hypothetical protein DCC85_12260 [Paenibacillus sp. CAA11]|uniref:SUKH-3 domain-containing protein n=1 Tax=Paenibacillus sp. CAA11 TaxID=1532905 RepID=UPI000D341D95|nr:SUKH-3 domain-containing protein [Paenibacillus sp. CAA11]AWB44916.1 hypothetical protein DCC85_12260 [Paenibacillus sp. CAA11]
MTQDGQTPEQLESELREQVILLLKKSGWYQGRRIDISKYKERCSEQGIELFPAAAAFLEEYSGIDRVAHFKYMLNHLDGPARESEWHEYEFHFVPNAVEELNCQAEMHIITTAAQEDCYCLGLSGYYYPAVTAIGRSGKLYLLHDYEPTVRVFDHLLESMEHEVGELDMITSSLLEPNQIMVQTVYGPQLSPEKVPNPFQ